MGKIKDFCFRNFFSIATILIALAAIISFWGFLKLHFMYDDWGMLWLAKNDLHRYLRFVTLWPGGSHPILIISFLPWVYLFGTNPIYYNILGLLLKIISSVLFGYFLYVLTKSRKFFLISGLIYATCFIGLEAFSITATRNLPYIIILLLLCLIFYIKDNFKYSLLFLFLATLSDPFRILPFPLLLLVMDNVLKKKRKFLTTAAILLITVFVGICVSGGVGRDFIFVGQSKSLSNMALAFSSKDNIQNVFASLGYLVSAYFSKNLDYSNAFINFIKTQEQFGIVIVSCLTALTIFLTLLNKKKNGLLLVFWLGAVLMYLPNWLLSSYYSVQSFHRYLALSGLFFIAFLSYFLYLYARSLFLYLFVAGLIYMNIVKSFQAAKEQSRYRDYERVENIYQQQEAIVPPGFKKGLFFFEGKNILTNNQMLWAAGGTIPFSFKRNITRFEEMPSFTSDYELAARMVCPGITSRIVINDWIPETVPIPMSLVYGFFIDEEGQLKNETDLIRTKVSNFVECLHKNINLEVRPGVKLLSYSIFPSEVSGKNIVNLNWSIAQSNLYKTPVEIFLYQTKTGKLVGQEKLLLPSGNRKSLTNFDTTIRLDSSLGSQIKMSMSGVRVINNKINVVLNIN